MQRPVSAVDPSRKKWSDSLKKQYPRIFCWGDIEYLSHEESVRAPVDARIRSIWPFLVKQVLRFADTLRPRDLANYDPEDVLGELWVALAEKDDKWEPDRGRYLTFAGRVVAHELQSIRDRSHTVHCPKNTGCRLKQYEAEADGGGISERRRKTYDDILRVLGEQEAMDADPLALSSPGVADAADRQEQRELARSTVREGVGVLTPVEAAVIGQTFGLFGHTETPVDQIAEDRGVSVERVKKIKGRAQAKIRQRLEDLGYQPAAD